MNLEGFISIANSPFFLKIKGFLFIIFILLSFVIVLYYFINQTIKKKAYNRLDSNQQKILRKGRLLRKKFKLMNLFTSVDGSKPVKVGRIEAYIEIKETEQTKEKVPKINIFGVFATRRGLLSDYRFYKIPTEKIDDYSDGIEGDVRLMEWNFILSKKSGFYELNTNKEYEYEVDIANNKNIDVMKEVGKSVIAGVLSDPHHRKEVRRVKLLKLPNSEMGE